MIKELSSFITHARSKGMDHTTIRLVLLSAGWKEKDIAVAMVEESLDMPVPQPRDSSSARDAFFHLLTFTTLYSTVISLIVLAFQYINYYLPDVIDSPYYSSDYYSSPIRWAIAVLIVSFPVLVLLARALHRDAAAQPEKLQSGVRRWLTYFTLFVTACVMLGDLVTLLFFLLQGELTMRFVLKVVAVLVCTGVPFSYYIQTLRMDAKEYASTKLHTFTLGLAAVGVVAAMIVGFMIVGSPSYGRLEKIDEQRLGDLRAIQGEILNIVYGQDRYAPISVTPKPTTLPKPLPQDLESVAQNAVYQKLNISDPVTGETYLYKPATTTFELCATFDLPRDQAYDIFWNHPVGEKCFQFDALEMNSR